MSELKKYAISLISDTGQMEELSESSTQILDMMNYPLFTVSSGACIFGLAGIEYDHRI